MQLKVSLFNSFQLCIFFILFNFAYNPIDTVLQNNYAYLQILFIYKKENISTYPTWNLKKKKQRKQNIYITAIAKKTLKAESNLLISPLQRCIRKKAWYDRKKKNITEHLSHCCVLSWCNTLWACFLFLFFLLCNSVLELLQALFDFEMLPASEKLPVVIVFLFHVMMWALKIYRREFTDMQFSYPHYCILPLDDSRTGISYNPTEKALILSPVYSLKVRNSCKSLYRNQGKCINICRNMKWKEEVGKGFPV